MNHFRSYLQRYEQGEWRAQIFRDLILGDVRRLGFLPVMLDIGCGSGFDGSQKIQAQLAEVSQKYIAVEPDLSVAVPSFVAKCYRCSFENADLAANSVDVAFCVMVLEHVAEEQKFWEKLIEILKPGGVFWGFTVDRRHFFSHVSMLMERLKIKTWFLDRLRGARGIERYENYQTFYRANSPRQIRPYVQNHFRCDFLSFSKVGQLDFYLPRSLRPAGHLLDCIQMATSLPGTLLAVRLEYCSRD